ncbi:MAG: AAA family ATPase [Thermoproteota archaeon]|nr:AAA family ATPase [Thermoproteota archaeon]
MIELSMYLTYFHLKEFPFLPSPDSRFLYLSDHVNETMQKCLYMIDNRIGPVYTSGPIGAGKTTLADRLQQKLTQEPERYKVTYLLIPPRLTVNSFLRLVMEEFAVKTHNSYVRNLEYLAAWLREQHQQGVKPVLILDEAQYLTPAHLKLLHFLLNYETKREKLLQIVLFGQTELSTKIERFPELKSRLYPASLTALNRADTEGLIAFRWFVAGGGKTLPFSPAVLDTLFQVTLGLPREIVKVCDLALISAYTQQHPAVQVEDVHAAVHELNLRTP